MVSSGVDLQDPYFYSQTLSVFCYGRYGRALMRGTRPPRAKPCSVKKLIPSTGLSPHPTAGYEVNTVDENEQIHQQQPT
jgi:hypothetical protein